MSKNASTMRFAERRVLQLNYSFNSFCTKQSANYVLGKDEVSGSNPDSSSSSMMLHPCSRIISSGSRIFFARAQAVSIL